MEFERKIYRFDWRKLTRWLLPVRLRGEKLTALAEALNSGVASIHAQFLNYKKEVAYGLAITPQVCYLVRLLNDRYDYTARRIALKDVAFANPALLALTAENKPLLLPLQSEGNPILLPVKTEVAQYAADFVVEVPGRIVLDEQEMKSLITSYQLPTKQFVIKKI